MAGIGRWVSYNSRAKKWRVYIRHKATWIGGGFYPSEAAAVIARDIILHRVRIGTWPAGFDPLTLPPTTRRFLRSRGITYEVRP